MSYARRTPLVLVSFAVMACEPEPGSSVGHVVVRDSSGIQLVQNPELAPDTVSWSIDPVPALVVGGDESLSEEYLFGSIAAAARLGDGRLVIADAQAGEVRLFDEHGRFLRRIGRRGRGPGEFRGVSTLWLMGDTIVVRGPYDGEPLQFFDSAGNYVRSWQPPEQGSPKPLALFEDGSILVGMSGSRNPRTSSPPPRAPLIIDYPEQLLRVDRAGEVLADFGVHATERSVHYSDHPRPGFELTAPVFLPQPRYVTSGDQLHLSDGDAFEIRTYDGTGRLVRVTRKEWSPLEIARSWSDSMWSATLTVFRDSEIGSWLVSAPPPPVPTTAPAMDMLLTDVNGNVWGREASLSAGGVRRWFIFDSTGVLQRSLATEVTPVQIGDDFVIALAQGANGVWTVRLHNLSNRSNTDPDA